MSERHWLGLAAACLLLAVCVAPARAGERDYWRSSGGHFENTSGNKWTEKAGDSTYHFVETARTEAYVELYDKSRDKTLRLYADRCEIRQPGTNRFERLYDGKWGGGEARSASFKVLQREPIPGGALVYETALSPDAKLFAAGLDGVGVVVWDGTTGKERYLLEGWLAEFTRDGKWLVTASGSSLLVHDALTGKRLFACPQPDQEKIWAFRLLPDSLHAVPWTAGKRYHLDDLESGKVLHSWPYEDDAYFAFTADGKFLLVKPAGASHYLAWDVDKNKPSDRFGRIAGYDAVSSFQPGNKQAFVEEAGKAYLADVADDGRRGPLPELPAGAAGASLGAADARVNLRGYGDGKLRLFDRVTGKEQAVFSLPDGEKVLRGWVIWLTPDARHACVGTDRSVYLLRLPDLNP